MIKYYDPEMWTPEEIKEDKEKQYIKKKVELPRKCPKCDSTNINEWYFDDYQHKCRDCGFYFCDCKLIGKVIK